MPSARGIESVTSCTTRRARVGRRRGPARSPPRGSGRRHRRQLAAAHRGRQPGDRAALGLPVQRRQLGGRHHAGSRSGRPAPGPARSRAAGPRRRRAAGGCRRRRPRAGRRPVRRRASRPRRPRRRPRPAASPAPRAKPAGERRRPRRRCAAWAPSSRCMVDAGDAAQLLQPLGGPAGRRGQRDRPAGPRRPARPPPPPCGSCRCPDRR